MRSWIDRLRGQLTPFFKARTAEAFPDLHREEAVFALREALQGTSDPVLRREAVLLRRLVVDRIEMSAQAEPAEEIHRLETTTRLPVGNSAISFPDAFGGMIHEASTERRAQLQRALGDHLLANSRPYAERIEAGVAVFERLQTPSYFALREEVGEGPVDPWLSSAQAFLRQTEDAFRDVSDYALRRLDPALRPKPSGLGQRQDLERATGAPWLTAPLSRGELEALAPRTMEQLGLHPSLEGRLRALIEPRTEGRSRVEIRTEVAPDRTTVLCALDGGLGDAWTFFEGYGQAVSLGLVSATLSPTLRLLRDGALGGAAGLFFAHLLLEPRYLRRHLGLNPTEAKELARLSALRSLMELRLACAGLSYQAEVARRGLFAEAADAYEAAYVGALFVGVHRGFYLRELPLGLPALTALRAAALEAVLYRTCLERYDEDFFRNPATGKALLGLYGRGGMDSAEQCAEELRGGKMSLEPVATRLLAALNA